MRRFSFWALFWVCEALLDCDPASSNYPKQSWEPGARLSDVLRFIFGWNSSSFWASMFLFWGRRSVANRLSKEECLWLARSGSKWSDLSVSACFRESLFSTSLSGDDSPSASYVSVLLIVFYQTMVLTASTPIISMHAAWLSPISLLIDDTSEERFDDSLSAKFSKALNGSCLLN